MDSPDSVAFIFEDLVEDLDLEDGSDDSQEDNLEAGPEAGPPAGLLPSPPASPPASPNEVPTASSPPPNDLPTASSSSYSPSTSPHPAPKFPRSGSIIATLQTEASGNPGLWNLIQRLDHNTIAGLLCKLALSSSAAFELTTSVYQETCKDAPDDETAREEASKIVSNANDEFERRLDLQTKIKTMQDAGRKLEVQTLKAKEPITQFDDISNECYRIFWAISTDESIRDLREGFTRLDEHLKWTNRGVLFIWRMSKRQPYITKWRAVTALAQMTKTLSYADGCFQGQVKTHPSDVFNTTVIVMVALVEKMEVRERMGLARHSLGERVREAADMYTQSTLDAVPRTHLLLLEGFRSG